MQSLIANRPKSATDWQTINWTAENRRVKNLRAHIFKATQAGQQIHSPKYLAKAMKKGLLV